MFGLGFGEIVVIAVLALVVLGPRELPTLLRSLGRMIAKLRRTTSNIRKESGIDDIIREEGLHEELATLRALRGLSAASVVESFIDHPAANARKAAVLAAAATPTEDPYAQAVDPAAPAELAPLVLEGSPPDPEAEYPEAGCDAYGAEGTPSRGEVAPPVEAS